MAKNYNITQIVRYIQKLSPGEAKRLRDVCQARLTAIGQSTDSAQDVAEGHHPGIEYTDGNLTDIEATVNEMTHPGDTTNLQRIEAICATLAGYADDESSSSSSSVSSQSSSSSSSLSSSSSSSSSVSTSSSSQSA